jgi:hypothetical protein
MIILQTLQNHRTQKRQLPEKMMKRKLIPQWAALFTCCCLCLLARSNPNALKALHLNGNVKSIKKNTYKAIYKFGEMKKGERIDTTDNLEPNTLESSSLITFNTEGNVTEAKFFNAGGMVNSKYTTKYDNKGNIIENCQYDSAGAVGNKRNYKYDDKGNVIEIDWYNADGSPRYSETTKYDGKGNLIEKTEYNSDGSIRNSETNVYDTNGNVLEHTEGKNTNTGFKYTYKRDSKGKVIAEYSSYGNSKVQHLCSTYKNDSNGNRIEENDFDLDNKLCNRVTFKYDDKGNKIEENRFNPDGTPDFKITTSYDDKGNIIEESKTNSGGYVYYKYIYKYEYDSNGNWVKRTDYVSELNIPKIIIEREIAYY